MKFNTDYYETLLNGIEKRVRIRNKDMDHVPNAVFRTLVDDGIIAELHDEKVVGAIIQHSYSDFNEATAISFSKWLLENKMFDDEDHALIAGEAFNRLFYDVQRRLVADSTAS